MILQGPQKRSLDQKAIWALRIISFSLRGSSFKEAVEVAFKSKHLGTRLDMLRKLVFDQIEFEASVSTEEVWKKISFQMGQLMGLLDGIELLTKREVAITYPVLRDAIKRLPLDSDKLIAMSKFKDQMCDRLTERVSSLDLMDRYH